MKVLVLHTLPPEAVTGDRYSEEFDLASTAEAVAEVLPKATVAAVRGEVGEVIDVLAAHRPGVVFNLGEAPLGRPDLEPHLAALLEWLNVRFTGSGSETLALCRHKNRTKAVLEAAGIPVPRSGGFPCIVKPAAEDASAGIHSDSVCFNQAEMELAATRWPGPVITEEFLPGREFVVSLWGSGEGEHWSVGETLFQGGVRLNTYEAKWDSESYEYRNSPLVYNPTMEDALRERVVSLARRAWGAARIRGYARIDIRLNAAGEPAVIDLNPNAALSPGAGMHRAVIESGWSFESFVRLQVALA